MSLCELKIAQLEPSSEPRLFITYNMIYIYVMKSLGSEDELKRANTLSTIRALAERAEFVRLPNDEILDEIPRFASVQSNYSSSRELPIHGL